jgi:hypothetical protein
VLATSTETLLQKQLDWLGQDDNNELLMHSNHSHRAQRPFHRLSASAITLVYLLLLLTPLLPRTAFSAASAHRSARECSGSCELDGCSYQSRVNKTCCCSKKSQQQAHSHEDEHDDTPDCCKTKPTEKKTVIACGCPCGSDKQSGLATTTDLSDVLPFHFSEQFSHPHSETLFSIPAHHLTSRYSDPPDPPPKLSFRS